MTRRSTIDFDLHGMVGIRLVDASAADAAVVERQVGPIQGELRREPDILIRFVDRLEVDSTVRLLGLDDAGFTDDSFLVLRSKHKARARVLIPFERIGQQCEIVCERGLPAIPLLLAIVNLTALGRGALPLHASAYLHDGVGILATGWAKGGKTESLLGFAADGADYVGDEWIYITGDGEHMHGIPEPIRLWDWHLRGMPRLMNLVGRAGRARLGLLRGVVGVLEWIERGGRGTGARRPSSLARFIRRLLPLIQAQQCVQLPPHRLFGADHCPLRGPLQRVFLVMSHESEEIRVEPITPEVIARRMVFSLQEERRDFMSYYTRFRFAFPECPNELIERVEEIERDALERVLAGKPTYAVYHPYPVSIPALFEAMREYV